MKHQRRRSVEPLDLHAQPKAGARPLHLAHGLGQPQGAFPQRRVEAEVLLNPRRVVAVQVLDSARDPADLRTGEFSGLRPPSLREHQDGQQGIGRERDPNGLRQQRPQFAKRGRLIGNQAPYA